MRLSGNGVEAQGGVGPNIPALLLIRLLMPDETLNVVPATLLKAALQGLKLICAGLGRQAFGVNERDRTDGRCLIAFFVARDEERDRIQVLAGDAGNAERKDQTPANFQLFDPWSSGPWHGKVDVDDIHLALRPVAAIGANDFDVGAVGEIVFCSGGGFLVVFDGDDAPGRSDEFGNDRGVIAVSCTDVGDGIALARRNEMQPARVERRTAVIDAAGFVDPADKANLERELGLSQPIAIQYLHWIGGLLHGDLGYSYVSEKPALEEILPRIPITARLAGLALLFSASIGIPLGVISAVHQGSKLDYALRVVSLSGLSLPSFWLGLLILMASVSLFGTMPIFNPNPKTWLEAFSIYAVPAMAVGFRSAALTMRITRSSMLEILRQDYIRTARAKGASEASVNYHHALKNAVLPVITVIGIEAAFLIGGLIVTETVFNIPGIARFLVEALRWRDYPIVQNLVMLIAVAVVVVNFIVDMLYAAIDPRIRFGD